MELILIEGHNIQKGNHLLDAILAEAVQHFSLYARTVLDTKTCWWFMLLEQMSPKSAGLLIMKRPPSACSKTDHEVEESGTSAATVAIAERKLK